MALTTTWIQELLSKNTQLDNRIYRASRYGALDVFRSSNNSPVSILSAENVAEFQAALGKTMKIPVIDFDGTISIGSSRSTTISDAENTSQYITVSPTTLTWGFTTFPFAHYNNSIAYEKDLQTKFMKFLNKVLVTVEGLCLTKLNADKTQYLADNLGYTFASDVLTATEAEKEMILADLSVMMNANDYYGKLHLIGNPGVQSLINQLLKYNKNNDKDLSMEYGDKALHFTNQLANAGGVKATGYIVEDGSVGLLTRASMEAITGYKSTTGKEFSTWSVPGLGVEAEYYYYSDVVDASAIHGSGSAHLTRSGKEYHGFAFDLALLTAHVTTRASQASPILKFAIDKNP